MVTAELQKRMTVEEFEVFAALPENEDRLLEFIGGEIFEVSSNPYASKLGARIGGYVGKFVEDHNLGHVTGADGGYWVAGERYIPDVGFISYARQPDELPSSGGYNPNAPDLAIEVFSPTDSERKLAIKVHNYITAGTVVWVLFPDTKQIDVYVPGQPVKSLHEAAVLDGGTVLTGFTLEVAKVFA